MKKRFYWLFLAFTLLFSACNSEDENEDLIVRLTRPSADTTVQVGAEVRFAAEYSTSPNNLQIRWLQNGIEVATTAEALLRFEEFGEYEIELQVRGFGKTVSDTRKVRVLDRYSRGAFIGCEGNFGQGNATVSFLSPEGQIRQGIFATENARPLGDILQSVALQGDKAYLVVNASHKVEVVNRHTFKSSSTLTGNFQNPRYFHSVSDTKAYLSTWGNPFSGNTIAPKILILDTNTDAIIGEMPAGAGAEYIASANGKAFVGNSFTTNIYVYDIASNTLIDSLDTAPYSPYQMQVDKNGTLWVMTFAYDENFQTPIGALYNFSTGSLRKNSELTLSVAPLNVRGNLQVVGDNLYFQLSDGIYKTSLAAPSLPTAPLIAGSFRNFELTSSGDIWTLQADFSNPENNKVLIFNPSGAETARYQVGIGAGSFAFAE
ncbi:DUF5074 domain-containing protein [Hugenholtzia roseola]|uniref:DUF5074 domain-containing protein n=1 Tax=Hugenholtzia roseola TaxID=1002 RepID=UPI000421CC29|nr:DUF5074 domain-containing protein [Hugenholtzia roseola]